MAELVAMPWVATYYDSLEQAHENGAFLWADEWPAEHGWPAEVWRGTPETGQTGLPGSIETTEQFGNLIAAAPDLLAAAERAAGFVCYALEFWDWSRFPNLQEGAELLRTQLIEAIAKAKGGAE